MSTLDKVEFGIKIEQIEKLKAKGAFNEAAEIADSIEWRKVKKWSELMLGTEVYEKARRDKDARNLCVYAYNRNLGGRTLVYKLAELSIVLNDLEEAEDLLNEFIEMAPHDMSKFVLLYKLNKARGTSNDKLIKILEEYKDNELDEKYGYELAELYSKEGRIDECIKECDDLILWFNDGEYVEKALDLKKCYVELTPSQKEKLHVMKQFRQAGLVYEASLERYENDPEDIAAAKSGEMKELENKPVRTEDIKVPEKDYSVYDTQNLQAELAKNMEIIMASMKPEDEDYKVVAPVIEMPEEFENQACEEEMPEDINSEESITEEIVPEEEELPTEPQTELPEIEEDLPEEEEETSKEDDKDWETVEDETVEDETEDETEDENEEIEVDSEEPESEYDTTLFDDEMAATAEPINVEVIELQISEDEDEVDEPTREIIINTHRWNQIKSVMEPIEEDESDKELKGVVTPATEAEDTVTEEQPEEIAAEEPETEEVATEENKEAAPQLPPLEDSNPVQMELKLEEPPIQGQMDLLDYLEHINVSVGETAEIPPVMDYIKVQEEKPVDKVDKLVKETVESGALNQEEEAAIDEALDKLTQQLIEEVSADIENKAIEEEEKTYFSDDIDDDSEEMDEESDDEDEYEGDNTLSYDEKLDKEADQISDLDENEKRYIKKYLFMSGLETSILHVINGKKKEVKDGTSRHGNIIIMGKRDTDKTGFAINLFKSIHANDEERELKIAKTTAEVLNAKGVASAADKIKGTTLIVENAERITKEVLIELDEYMNGKTDSMLVIFTGEEFALKKLFRTLPSIREKFDYKLEIKHYNSNELIEIAKEYAKVRGYSIDEKALPNLYITIGEFSKEDVGSEIEKIKKIVDSAIIKNGKPSRNFWGKKRSGLITLKEKHFINKK